MYFKELFVLFLILCAFNLNECYREIHGLILMDALNPKPQLIPLQPLKSVEISDEETQPLTKFYMIAPKTAFFLLDSDEYEKPLLPNIKSKKQKADNPFVKQNKKEYTTDDYEGTHNYLYDIDDEEDFQDDFPSEVDPSKVGVKLAKEERQHERKNKTSHYVHQIHHAHPKDGRGGNDGNKAKQRNNHLGNVIAQKREHYQDAKRFHPQIALVPTPPPQIQYKTVPVYRSMRRVPHRNLMFNIGRIPLPRRPHHTNKARVREYMSNDYGDDVQNTDVYLGDKLFNSIDF